MVHITEPTQERFRSIKGQIRYFPQSIEISKYELFGYLSGALVCKTQGLSLDHFDQIQFVRESVHQIKKGEFIHAIGWRARENQFTVLVLIKK